MLRDCELVVVTGKGGVGKTTVAAALAAVLARNRRVTLLEVDPRESAHRLFDIAPSGGEPVTAGPRLRLLHAEPRRIVDEIVRSKLKLGPLVRRLQASPVYEHFVDGAPGLKELAVLRSVHDMVTGAGRDTDCVVLDSPATGHAAGLLAAPGLVADAIATGPIAKLAGEVASWLRGETVSVAMVTLAEELSVTESLEAGTTIEELLGRPPELWVANALYPECSGSESNGDELTALWRSRRAVNERELERLENVLDRPAVKLPLLPIDEGHELIRTLGEALSEPLGAPIQGDEA